MSKMSSIQAQLDGVHLKLKDDPKIAEKGDESMTLTVLGCGAYVFDHLLFFTGFQADTTTF